MRDMTAHDSLQADKHELSGGATHSSRLGFSLNFFETNQKALSCVRNPFICTKLSSSIRYSGLSVGKLYLTNTTTRHGTAAIHFEYSGDVYKEGLGLGLSGAHQNKRHVLAWAVGPCALQLRPGSLGLASGAPELDPEPRAPCRGAGARGLELLHGHGARSGPASSSEPGAPSWCSGPASSSEPGASSWC